MRIGVLSDIHANLHALEAVLDELAFERPDALWCLGDVVGYGARPNECCALVRERVDLCLAGNHDLAALGKVDVEGEFNPDAARCAQWTASALSAESRATLEPLDPRVVLPEVDLCHGSPVDPVWSYVLSSQDALAAIGRAQRPLLLVGHSHIALSFALGEEELAAAPAPEGTLLQLEGARRWLLNPGAVGQPRDGDPRAAYLLLDLEQRTASFRRVTYDIERTQAEIRAAGLPEPIAARLKLGM